MVKWTLAFFISLLMVINIQARNDSTSATVFGLFLTYSNQFSFADPGPLNEQLELLGYPESKLTLFNPGWGVQLQVNRFILSYSTNRRSVTDDNNVYISETSYRNATFFLGFDAIKQPRFSLYPFVGLSRSQYKYAYASKPQGTVTFDNYFEGVLDAKEINNRMMHLDLGIGFSVQNSWLLGVRGGYLIPLQESQFTAFDGSIRVNNAPEMSYNYYLTVTIGIGSVTKSRGDIRRGFKV
jgi:hypothetical protein